MTRDLHFKRRGAAAGQGRSMVVFLHGYGADGTDLLGLADGLVGALPHTVFLAADAPEACSGNPFGFQWFPIPWLDGSTEAAATDGLLAAAQDLNLFLDQRLVAEGLNDAALALVGFSQGAMMAMHVAPRRAQAMAGVVAISGRLLLPDTLVAETKGTPPVLLVHGDQDEVVPFGNMGFADTILRNAGFDTQTHVMRGVGHGIAPDGLRAAQKFLVGQFGAIGAATHPAS